MSSKIIWVYDVNDEIKNTYGDLSKLTKVLKFDKE